MQGRGFYEVNVRENGDKEQFYYRLLSHNKIILAVSANGYPTIKKCLAAISSLRKIAATETINLTVDAVNKTLNKK